MNIPLYGQRDPRWDTHSINGTDSTIGHYGCTICCEAMLFSYSQGHEVTPLQMEDYIRRRKGFQKDLILWKSIEFFRQRFYCETSPAPVEEIRNQLRQGRPVLVNVHLGSGAPKPNHWVLVVDENFTVNDPWYNETVNISHRYGKPEIAILGGAYFDVPLPEKVQPKPVDEPPMAEVQFKTRKEFNEEIFKNIFIAYFGNWPSDDQLSGYRSFADANGGEPYTAFQTLFLVPDKTALEAFYAKEIEAMQRDFGTVLATANKNSEVECKVKIDQALQEAWNGQAEDREVTGSLSKIIKWIVNIVKGAK